MLLPARPTLPPLFVQAYALFLKANIWGKALTFCKWMIFVP